MTGAVLCPEGESRMIVSVDTSKMNRIHWIDTENMMARIEAGVTVRISPQICIRVYIVSTYMHKALRFLTTRVLQYLLVHNPLGTCPPPLMPLSTHSRRYNFCLP